MMVTVVPDTLQVIPKLFVGSRAPFGPRIPHAVEYVTVLPDGHTELVGSGTCDDAPAITADGVMNASCTAVNFTVPVAGAAAKNANWIEFTAAVSWVLAGNWKLTGVGDALNASDPVTVTELFDTVPFKNVNGGLLALAVHGQLLPPAVSVRLTANGYGVAAPLVSGVKVGFDNANVHSTL